MDEVVLGREEQPYPFRKVAAGGQPFNHKHSLFTSLTNLNSSLTANMHVIALGGTYVTDDSPSTPMTKRDVSCPGSHKLQSVQ